MGGRTRRVGIKVDADVRDFNAGMASASRSVRSLVLELGAASQSVFSRANLMQAGIVGVAVGAATALKQTVGAAASFEVQMRNVNSIVQASELQFQKMSADVLALAGAFPQSADTLAAGLYDIASSGFQGAEGIQVLEASARAATAGMTDTATAAQGITAVLNAYGLEAKDAADVSDILFQTVNLGVITFEELASELGDVVGIAAAAGVGIDQVGAALAAMTLSGIDAAESTTSLGRLIESLVQPSDQLQAVWKTVSNESIATALAQDGLASVMERLSGVVGNNVQVLLALFPNIRAARGAFAVLANEGDNYARAQAGITDEQRRANATQKAFNEQMKATGNQLRLVANGTRVWATELGAKALPAIRQLVDTGRDFASTVTPAFQVFGDVVGYVGELAGDHLEIVYALALAYGVNLLKGIIVSTGALLLNTAQLVIARVEALAASSAYVGLGVTMGAIAGQAAIMGAALVAGLAIKNWIEAKNHAKELVTALKEGVDTSTLDGLKEWNSRLTEQGMAFEDNREQMDGWKGAVQDLEDLLPWADDKHAKNTQAIQENAAAQEEASTALANFVDNAIAAGNATGMNIDQIDKLAKKYGIDLTQGGAAGKRAVAALTESIEEAASEVGLTKEQFAALGPEAVESLKAITDAADDATDHFLDTFSLLSDFELPNAKQAAQDAEDALDKVRDAEEKLADSRANLDDNQSYITRTPEREREEARLRREVAAAERDLAEAREEAREATQRQLDPEAAMTEQYDKQIKAAEQFVNDIDTVAKMAKERGLDVNEFLLKAQSKPGEYAPILRAIAEDTDGSLLATIEVSEKRLQELGATFKGQFGLMKVAVDNGMMAINDTMLEYLERAFTDPDGEKGVLAFRFGAYLMEAVKNGMVNGTSPFSSGGGSADLGIANLEQRARGGVDAHVASSPTILYGERSTGGEAFIPLGSAHRGRSSMLLAQVARQFGYGLIQMERGGIRSGWSAGSGGSVTNFNKRSEVHIGEVRAHDYHDFQRQMDRDNRIRALTGG